MTDLMVKFYEKLSCGLTSEEKFEKKSVLKSPMQLRIYFQRFYFNYEKKEYCKNKTNISLPDQYSMSFPDKHLEVIYIVVSIKLHIGKDMDKGHYVCGLLDYNTGTWWNYYDETITQYPGYPSNV